MKYVMSKARMINQATGPRVGIQVMAGAMALALAACGGGGGGGGTDGGGTGGGGVTSYQVSVTVSGLTGSVMLQNNGKDNLELNGDGMVRFATPVDVGGAYNVTVFTQPADRVCVVQNGVGVMTGAVNINVTCSATRALFISPRGMALDGAGNLMVTDSGTIRMVSMSGRASTLAGEAGFTGAVDGLGAAARFDGLDDVVVDKSGFTYVSDSRNNTIRKINKSGLTQTWAGTAGVSGSVNGTGSSALFKRPKGLVTDKSGNIFVADSLNCVIRKITLDGVVSTFAGLAGACGVGDGKGSAGRLGVPQYMAIDDAGNIYVDNQMDGDSDLDTGYMQKISPDGYVDFLYLFDAVTGKRIRIGVRGMAVDRKTGNLFVVHKKSVKMITPDGFVSVFAGSPDQGGYKDGVGADVRFEYPVGIEIDGNGNLYVSDSANFVIRKITPSGAVSTYAGTPGVSGWLDN